MNAHPAPGSLLLLASCGGITRGWLSWLAAGSHKLGVMLKVRVILTLLLLVLIVLVLLLPIQPLAMLLQRLLHMLLLMLVLLLVLSCMWLLVMSCQCCTLQLQSSRHAEGVGWCCCHSTRSTNLQHNTPSM